MLRYETPLNITDRAKLRYGTISLLLLEEVMELLDLTVGPNKISTIIAPNESGISSAGNEPLRAAINASLVRSVTASKCTAFTDRETNTQMYA